MTTVLIVDDEIDMRVLVRMALEIAGEGLEVVAEATTGEEALQIWRDLDGPPVPDVVILDNRMPGLSGLEVAEVILRERPGQRIVLYSAHLNAHVDERAAELGIARVVPKDQASRLGQIIRDVAAT